ncbi:methylated-DNA--protein-cysteine methyltransferase [Planctomycetales bacterium]|nr:methylated-DNA--protein-cysteine methyltransferase [Planctomycetales bacterium]GHT07460.1 methylated-DNA--protein-cysteine methyltransferase [Planctomycetales bacterium]
MHYTTNYSSPLGSILLASDGESIIGAWLAGQKHHGGALKDEAVQKDDLSIFTRARNWLDRYFNGDKPAVAALPLAPVGGEFRQTVWNILREIPYGKTLAYGDIARTIAAKTGKERVAAQAVGGAVGHNPISIIIPCHRVVGANGSLTGYAGGIDKKIQLLKHEGVATSRFFVPLKGTAL